MVSTTSFIAVANSVCVKISDMLPVLFLNLGAGEIVVIALVVLLLFGGRKIPELMKGLGRGVKSFKDSLNEIEKDIKE